MYLSSKFKHIIEMAIMAISIQAYLTDYRQSYKFELPGLVIQNQNSLHLMQERKLSDINTRHNSSL